MEKSRVTRQRSTRAPGASASSQSPSQSLVNSSSRLRLPAEKVAEEGEAVSSSSQPTFNALELLGPSLSQVLTLVTPPQPRKLQDTEAGESTAEGNQSSSSFNAKASAKFDLRLSRSAVLGKLVDPTIDNARKTQEYFAKLLSKIQCEVTGLVLLHDATVVIFLETTAEQFVAILKQLQQQRLIDASSMKVLANCDDHGARILQGLYFKKIVMTRSDTSEWTDESAAQCVVETFLNLLKFIKKIGPMPPGDIRKCLTNLSNTDQSFLPPNDLVLWLLGREELMTIDEYVNFVDNPVAVELQSERVWPVHPLIQY